MKINILFCLIFNFFFSLSFSQNPEKKVEQRHYISLKYYKLKYKEPLTKEDSLNFQYRNNDTLVLIKNYLEPKGVRVPYEFKDSTFLHYYKKVAFNHKKNVFSEKTSMKYWKSDLKIYFSKSISKSSRNKFMKFANSISENIDSLNIKKVNKLEDANYVIYFSEDMEYEPKLAENKNTSNYMHWNKYNQIFKASIKITKDVIDDKVMIQNKLKYFFIGSLGYFNLDTDFNCNSYFSKCKLEFGAISPFDLELIKYHYSYGICKGTTLKTFEEQHKKAQETLRNHNYNMFFIHSN